MVGQNEKQAAQAVRYQRWKVRRILDGTLSSIQAANYQKRKNKPGYKAAYNLYSQRYRDRDPRGYLIVDARRRAKERGRPFNITKEYVHEIWPVDGCCVYCGVKMMRYTRHAPSLDEVVASNGYVVGNIEVICRLCNSHKNNHPVEWFELVAARMRKAMEINCG